MDQNPQPGRGGRDIRGDKRKEETVMLSSENVADLVAQAKAEAPPAAPAAPPVPTPPAASTPAKGPNTLLIVGASVAVLLVIVLLVVLLG